VYLKLEVDIPRPKEDIKIEKRETTFKSALSDLVKNTTKKPNRDTN